MTNQSIWIGITIGVFFVGLAIGIIPNEMEKANVQANIERFDHLDFVLFNEKDWEVFSELHHPDVLVGYSDGRVTTDIEAHQPDVEFVFTWAPDVQITDHPITFGQGPWTAGTGVVEGTFTEPMILSDGTVIEPTDKKFKYTMVTIAKWKDGQITEEYLYWDNAEVARQLGLKSESTTSKKLQIEELIKTFKEKYSDREITKFPDSTGIPYKYVAHTDSSDIELLLEKDRVVLKAWNNGDALCIVSNPIPRDILDNCPLKW